MSTMHIQGVLLTIASYGLPAQLRDWPAIHRTWPPQPCVGSCASTGTLATHDFNGDGRPDIVDVSEAGVMLWDAVSSNLIRSLGPPSAPPPYAVTIVPDLDNDSVAEIVVGARNLPPRALAPLGGGAFVLSGASGNLVRLIEETDAQLGSDVCSAGDVDLDGVQDLLVGGANQLSNQSCARVFSGRTGARLRSYQEPLGGGYFGESVCAGDINADGRLDHVVGAPGAGGGIGAIYAYDGSSGAAVLAMNGTRQGSLFGIDVALVADFDQDARPDVLVGAPMTGNRGGEMLIVSSRTGSTLRTFRAAPWLAAWWDAFGWWVYALPDIDGDGIGDVMGNGQTQSAVHPSLWLFSGRDAAPISRIWDRDVRSFAEGPIAAADLDGDGIAEVISAAINGGSTTRQITAYSLRSPTSTLLGGVGCPASRALVLNYGSTPRLGRNLSIQISNGPASTPTLAVVLLSAFVNPAGIDLSGNGMPGCRLYVEQLLDTYPLVLTGTGALPLPIPRDGTQLCGATLYHQALALDAGANAPGISVSNYGAARVGF